ncbi:glutaredoxin 2 [Marinomonas aquimarina]|uniref:Glutaredoxin 2 n=1 Tax=Marinomonas aquimarina TaxID=295068 RepID=A0A1A8T637_9GAMM|nr:glutathione S-transferase [Marinomonas aquimarina]SBS27091.1 glutaredoxin 2 [Marinomonas aquimarina]
MLAILYSFRRCPYAMRARYALVKLGTQVELREVVLKNKPEALLNLGGRSTVPQLLVGAQRFPESMDIMFWAIEHAKDQTMAEQLWPAQAQQQAKIRAWIGFNDHCFKPWLDRYKYADRHPEFPESYYRQKGERFLQRLETRLAHSPYLLGAQMTLADMAVFPFIRQFAGVNSQWFETSPYPHLKRWLTAFLQSDDFKTVMLKYPAWEEGQTPIYFPEPSQE